ncbi:MAG: alginate export family protein [Proteobacteria bacterium]|nr:alginate export family protein [Pseudomonadota bacterium]
MAAGILAAWASPGSVAAEEGAGLKHSGSIRIRQEALDGQFRPGFDNHDDVLVMRSSLFAEWDTGAWRFGGELVDSRAYDTDAGSVLNANDVDAFEPVQAYVAGDFDTPFRQGQCGHGAGWTLHDEPGVAPPGGVR